MQINYLLIIKKKKEKREADGREGRVGKNTINASETVNLWEGGGGIFYEVGKISYLFSDKLYLALKSK